MDGTTFPPISCTEYGYEMQTESVEQLFEDSEKKQKQGNWGRRPEFEARPNQQRVYYIFSSGVPKPGALRCAAWKWALVWTAGAPGKPLILTSAWERGLPMPREREGNT